MALPSYVLISEEEYRDRSVATGTDQAENIEAAVLAATLAIERRLDRLLVSRGSITEYHTPTDRQRVLYLGQWPFIAFTSVHESIASPPVYDADSLLVAGTTYETVAPQAIRRLSYGSPSTWARGNRSVRVVYTAGYTNTAAVPADLKHVCFYIAAAIFRETDRKQWGVSAATDAQGNYQRVVGYFTPALDEMLAPYMRRDFNRTWELAA